MIYKDKLKVLGIEGLKWKYDKEFKEWWCPDEDYSITHRDPNQCLNYVKDFILENKGNFKIYGRFKTLCNAKIAAALMEDVYQ